jgi:DNA replication factor CDT1 like/DNA replication factor Cdt1 C-terminal domain
MVGSNVHKRRRAEPAAAPAPMTPGLVTEHARVRKPGLGAAPPPSKRLKASEAAAAAAPAAAVVPSATLNVPDSGDPSPAPASKASRTRTIARPKQQSRISDLLAADRQRRARIGTGPPAIVTGVPHMDTRRPAPVSRVPQGPKTSSAVGDKGPAAAATAAATTAAAPSSVALRARKPPLPPTRSALPFRPAASTPADIPVKKATAASVLSERSVLSKATSAKIQAPGGEALRYDRTLLPEKDNLLLDILSGLEQAESLLATRRTTAEFAAVRKIVASVTKRTFTLRHLSQLAALVPEAVAVLPPAEPVKQTTARSKAAVASASALAIRRNDRLIIRLDDVTHIVNGGVQKKAKTGKLPRLGDAAARGRHRLLLTRLREHVEDWHLRFLRREGIKNYAGSLWHPKFRPDRHVADLPAPPLYPPVVPPLVYTAAAGTKTEDGASKPVARPLSAVDDLLMSPSHGTAAVASQLEESKQDSLPSSAVPPSLLARVRAREAAKAVRDEAAPAAAERITLAQLPATLDAVRSVLSSGRRSAMGWAALAAATAAAHPAGRTVAEVASHMDALAVLAGAWCEKRALSGPRGGYAFRITDDALFSEARHAVVEAKGLPELLRK